MNIQRIATLLLSLLTASALQAQTWTATSLHPAGAADSFLFATTKSQQAGFATIGGHNHASIWAGSVTSFVDFNPSAVTADSQINATTGVQQAGFAVIGGMAHACIWAGSAPTFLDIHPVAATKSSVEATTGSQQAGFATIGGHDHAAIWAGSAASFIDLNPSAAATDSRLTATTGAQQAGYIMNGGTQHAGIWTGSATSFVDLNPGAIADVSYLKATTGAQQAGAARIGGHNHAAIWAGSPATFQDLHPAGSDSSVLNATDGSRQVGNATFGGDSHAGIWAGSATSFLDLQSFLPTNYSASYAESIWSDGHNILVAGRAHNSTLNREEAILWKFTPAPAPPTVTVLRKSLKPTSKSAVTIRGTVADRNGGRLRVLVKVGKIRFRPAKVSQSKWTFRVSLSPGSNLIKIYARDSTHRKSRTRTVRITRL